jgi:branched-subunit amino acid ABC-type transport system permease component
MSPFFFFVQLLNAVQYGLILYLVASGLTLLLGIMGVINLAHGAFYMVGAYMAFAVVQHLASFWLALPLAIVLGLALGALLERFLLSRLEGADHLSQVLLSFGLILIINEGQRIIFGNDPHGIDVPPALNFSIPLSDTFAYPAYRLFVCAIGIAFAVGVSLVMARTRIGMMLRASAENRPMARALGSTPSMYLRRRGGHRLCGAGRRDHSADLGLSAWAIRSDPVVRGDCAGGISFASRRARGAMLLVIDAFANPFELAAFWSMRR